MINASKRSKYVYVKMKDEAINVVGWSFKRFMPGMIPPTKADYEFTWYCPNKRKDKDNIMAGQKFVFDALQHIGFIKNDGWKQIGSVTHRFEVDKNNPRIEVEIREVS
ncbi:RusA family crossover junction endodeoxyribonuclease [Cohnella sp. GCM10027633]|uniref:RusA family crossover junction endodeoxyribonuclease n=1 Tax=unclassified Cohnella TaxID=2636738 RepID=UPI003630B031